MSIKVIQKTETGKGMNNAEFDQLRHFFFSGLLEQSYQMVKLEKGNEMFYGELLSITFMVDKEKTIQRFSFSKYEADTNLKPEQEKQFCSLINIDLSEERKICRSIFIQLDMQTQKIFLLRNFDNGNKEEKII